MKTLHKKIQELRLKAAPITMSGSYVDKDGKLQMIDFKISSSLEDRTIKGYLAVWGIRDSQGELLIKGAFAKSISERGPASVSKQKIAFLWMHDCCDPIGRFTILKEDKYGLYFEAVADNVENGDRALEQTKSGTLNQFSVGYDYVWDKMEYDEQTDTIITREGILMEGSIVTFGANAETYVIKSAADFASAKVELMEITDDFIRSIPRERQLELRHLITKHITLAQTKPQDENRKSLVLSLSQPNEFQAGKFKINLKNFSL